MEPQKEANLEERFRELVDEGVEDTDELPDELLETVDELVDESLTWNLGPGVEAVERQRRARKWAWIHRKRHWRGQNHWRGQEMAREKEKKKMRRRMLESDRVDANLEALEDEEGTEWGKRSEGGKGEEREEEGGGNERR